MRSVARTIGINALWGAVPIVGYVLLIILESAHIIGPFSASWVVLFVVVSVGALIWANRHLFSSYPRLSRAVLVTGTSLSVVVVSFAVGMVAIAFTVGVP